MCGKPVKSNQVKNSSKDEAEVKRRLIKENPFLAAIIQLTENKTEHLKCSNTNAKLLREPTLELKDFKQFNTYSKSLDFEELLLTYSKKY